MENSKRKTHTTVTINQDLLKRIKKINKLDCKREGYNVPMIATIKRMVESEEDKLVKI